MTIQPADIHAMPLNHDSEAGHQKQKNEEILGAPQEKYKPTPKEYESLCRYSEIMKSTPPRMKVSISQDKVAITYDHPQQYVGSLLVMESLGISDRSFFDCLIQQLVNVGSNGKPDEVDINFMLAFIRDIGPKDQFEIAVAAQMAAVHLATLRVFRRVAHAKTSQEQDGAVGTFTKLTRTFTTQMEALKRYRTGGNVGTRGSLTATQQPTSAKLADQRIAISVRHRERPPVAPG